MSKTVQQIDAIFWGSDSAATRSLMSSLTNRGRDGNIASELFRAQKASTRAKQYRGKYRDYQYYKKDDCLTDLCYALAHSGWSWGWATDESAPMYKDVLYIDLPEVGQVSFHATRRGDGPDYQGEWDQTHLSCDRIIDYIAKVMSTPLPRRSPEKAAKKDKPKLDPLVKFCCSSCRKEQRSRMSRPKDWVNSDVCSISCQLRLDPDMTMPSGKHAAKRCLDLPEDYVDWVIRNVQYGEIREICVAVRKAWKSQAKLKIYDSGKESVA